MRRSLRVLRTRRDIACVLVNPVQAMHPNASAPADSGLIDSGRSAHFDRAAYSRLARRSCARCARARGIVLIFDEVFVGFRLAPGGAQEYFGVRADMVTYGKTLGGGLPVGVVCGRRDLMKRYRRAAAGGRVPGARHLQFAPLRDGRNARVPQAPGERADPRALSRPRMRSGSAVQRELNERLRAAQLPVQVAHLSSIWTVNYLQPSRYNWMFQYYLRAQGLALSWVGTARLIFSLNYSDADFAAVADRVLAAAEAMRRDGWWWPGTGAHQQGHQAPRAARAASGLVGHVLHRIDQLATQQVQRCAAVEFDVVKRVGEDLREPHEPGHDALLQAQLHGAEQQRAQRRARARPDRRAVAKSALPSRRAEDAEQRRIEPQHERVSSAQIDSSTTLRLRL